MITTRNKTTRKMHDMYSDEQGALDGRLTKQFRNNCKQCCGTGNPGKLHNRGQVYHRVCACGSKKSEQRIASEAIHQRDIQEPLSP